MTEALTTTAGNTVARQSMNGSELATSHETAATAVAERAKAEVQARYLMAIQRPRNLDEARLRILQHCKRPRFAEKARYAKPVGGTKIEGPSIRFVEAALAEYTNVLPESMIIYEDHEKMIVRVQVTDLEKNVTHAVDASVKKTVERRKLRAGQRAISQRTNTYGDPVYIVPATDDEVANKKAAAESKALRNLGLRILPADIVDEAMELVVATQRSQIKDDPDAHRKRLADAFYQLGVGANDLAAYLGHDLAKCVPAELEDLRGIYEAIAAGEAKWSDALDIAAADGEPPAKGKKKQKSPGKGAQAIKARLAARAADKKPPADKPAAAPVADEEPPADAAPVKPICKLCGAPTLVGVDVCDLCARS